MNERPAPENLVRYHNGAVVETARSRTRYRIVNVHPSPEEPARLVATIEREVPKVRGKAARKADKRARRLAHR